MVDKRLASGINSLADAKKQKARNVWEADTSRERVGVAMFAQR